jgi:hypothetical protein
LAKKFSSLPFITSLEQTTLNQQNGPHFFNNSFGEKPFKYLKRIIDTLFKQHLEQVLSDRLKVIL